jgi:hypothetical protein
VRKSGAALDDAIQENVDGKEGTMLYDLIFDDDRRFQVEFDEEPVGPKEITAKATYFTAVALQKREQQAAQLQDERGLCPWEPVSVVTTKLDPLHMYSQERTSRVVLKLG